MNKNLAYLPKVFIIMGYIGLLFIFLVQCFVMFTFLLFNFLYKDLPVTIRILTIGTALVIIRILPIWFKTFFEKDFKGFACPYLVEWSDDYLSFKGPFFRLKFPLSDILKYRKFLRYHLVITVRTNCRWNRKMWLYLFGMHNKMALIDLLNSNFKKQLSNNSMHLTENR